MADIIKFVSDNWPVFAGLGAAVWAVVVLVVRRTKTKKDDAILDQIEEIVKRGK